MTQQHNSIERTVAATDGSCLGNPGAGGWCWYVDTERFASGYEAHTTNNRMEIYAVVNLLETIPADVPLLIQADSRYVIDAATKWIRGWKRRSWTTANGTPVKNEDLFRSLDGLLARRDVRFEHVYGHRGHRLNELADTLARQAATTRQGRRPVGR